MTLGKDGRRTTVAPWSQSGAAHQILPPSLVDLIEPFSKEESDVEEETDQELDFSEVFDCDEDD